MWWSKHVSEHSELGPGAAGWRFLWKLCIYLLGLPRWLSSKELPCNARDPGLIPGSGRSTGGRNGNPLQYYCLENPTDRGAWWARVHGVTKSWTRLSDLASTRHLHPHQTLSSSPSDGAKDHQSRSTFFLNVKVYEWVNSIMQTQCTVTFSF